MREGHFIPEIQEAPLGAPAPADLRAALEDFYLSRQALRRTPATMEHFLYMTGGSASRLDSEGNRCPSEVCLVRPRVWLVLMAERGVKVSQIAPPRHN